LQGLEATRYPGLPALSEPQPEADLAVDQTGHSSG
jgi:hypothetical protein